MSGETYAGSRAPEIAASVAECTRGELLCPPCAENPFGISRTAAASSLSAGTVASTSTADPLAFDTMTDD